jgi:uncharacterized membrane protein YgcG
MNRKLLASVFAAFVTLFGARAAKATEVEIVVVMWQQDLSVKTEVEQFFGCLVNSSSFGTTWAQEFGLTRVSFRGVYVLNSTAPSTISLGGSANQVLEAAFAAGTVPSPSAGGTSYLLYSPSGTRNFDDGGVPACEGTYCGVHNGFRYNGTYYDAALVPIDCPDCGSVQATLIGEHEAAEAIANMGTAQYEVGDSCEGPSHETQLACCGTMYPIQQLSSNQGQSDCQTIRATGSMCGMPDAGVPDAAVPDAAVNPDASTGSGGSGGNAGSGAGGSGGNAGSGTGGSGGPSGSGGSAGNAATGDTSGGCAISGGGGAGGGWALWLVIAALARRRRSALPSRE